MYQHFPNISDRRQASGHATGTGGRIAAHLSDIYYFVLNHSKRFRGGNTALLDGVEMVCGTPVVHFPGCVVHAFPCTTIPPKTMYHP